ncbi:MAG TPA: hypothetical protein DDX20_08940 [Stenotrophomonas sp.]|nr:hypothetical protein [Stenotrophomonas sp.]
MKPHATAVHRHELTAKMQGEASAVDPFRKDHQGIVDGCATFRAQRFSHPSALIIGQAVRERIARLLTHQGQHLLQALGRNTAFAARTRSSMIVW